MIVCSEIKRVLKKTGSFWLNMGDTYSATRWANTDTSTGPWKSKRILEANPVIERITGLPAKCLVGIPWRLVLRLIDEQGWVLRNAGIWEKPNSMPSSVKDRLSNSYEFLFHLVKNTKPQYYWNEKTGLMADRKPLKDKQREGIDWDWQEVGVVNNNTFNVRIRDSETDRFMEKASEEEKKNYGKPKLKKKTYWHSIGYWYDLDAIREPYTEPLNRWGGDKLVAKGKASWDEGTGQNTYRDRDMRPNKAGKNPGDVWLIPTQPRKDLHFSTFPDALCTKPILATCPQEICRKCGKARVRVREPDIGGTKGHSWHDHSDDMGKGNIKKQTGSEYKTYRRGKTIGWTDCGCGKADDTCFFCGYKEKHGNTKLPERKGGIYLCDECLLQGQGIDGKWDSGIVLDPFAGRGTALIMAKKLGRHYVGYELKREYCEKLIEPALAEIDPLFRKEL